MKNFAISISQKQHFLRQDIQAETLEQAIEIAKANVEEGEVPVVNTDDFEVLASKEDTENGIKLFAYSNKEYEGWNTADVSDQLYQDSAEFPKVYKRVIEEKDLELQSEILHAFLDRLDISDQIDLLRDTIDRFEQRME